MISHLKHLASLSAGTMDAKEVVHCAVQIERSAADRSYGDVSTLLGDLNKLRVTAEQLETTDIVRVLYRLLKSCPDHGVKKAAKGLLSKWKREYGRDRRGQREGPGFSEQGDSHADPEPPCDRREDSVKCEDGAQNGLQTPPPPAESSSPSCSFASVRSKCVQLLLAALCPEPPDQDEAAELAKNIEQHIHQLHTSSQIRYKACVRSKVANLRNPKNKHLRRGLLSGSLAPETFARMSAEEMASAELRRLREEYSSRGVSERQLPRGVEGTRTQKIRCERCGGSDCEVTQVSRGALFLPAWVRRGGPDEDAMTFVTCSRCGQQWYHSGWNCL